MIIDVKENRVNKPEQAKIEHEKMIEEFESLDIDDILRGSIMAATGQNKVLGVDYTLQKDKNMGETRKYQEITAKVADMIAD